LDVSLQPFQYELLSDIPWGTKRQKPLNLSISRGCHLPLLFSLLFLARKVKRQAGSTSNPSQRLAVKFIYFSCRASQCFADFILCPDLFPESVPSMAQLEVGLRLSADCGVHAMPVLIGFRCCFALLCQLQFEDAGNSQTVQSQWKNSSLLVGISKKTKKEIKNPPMNVFAVLSNFFFLFLL
jgi:hypothetical protein